MERAETEAALAALLDHPFAKPELLREALTHSSARNRRTRDPHGYERLEFLGDRVLGLIVAELLFRRFPREAEGDLTRRHTGLVRREALTQVAEATGLGGHILLSPGEAAAGSRANPSVLADVCEAVIAALYLDGGFAVARAFIERNWEDQFVGLNRDMRDAKTALQEWSQGKKGGIAPVYKLAKREGPDHAPRFWVDVSVAGHEPITGEGSSKREAEQAAARAMLSKLGLQD